MELSQEVLPEISVDEATAKAFIYEHESGNDPYAVNESSGACGIGQALPCEKMPCALGDYACQDIFFQEYMYNRYGTWVNAMNYWNCIGYCTNNYGTIYKTATWW